MNETQLNTEKASVFVRLKNYFSTYEKWWMLSMLLLTVALAIILPEDDANGVSGWVITLLYVFDVLIGLLCELLFSKQNRWAFLIYNAVEVIEIVTMIILRVRFASLAVAMFYWIPAHTLGFFQWNRFKDKRDKNVTVVRRLKTWQTVLIFVLTAVWTLGIGYLVAKYSPDTDFYSSDKILVIVAYLDACLSIMSIIDGILMFFRSRESWWTWYLYIFIETVVNIISHQWILLVYKIGYLTNTTYGLIKWSKYINENESVEMK
jgi:nicotinamide mononucleotide transporter